MPYAVTGGVNSMNAFRTKDSKVPLEFMYTPATERFFYTKDMARDYRNVWKEAARRMWGYEVN